MSTHPIGTTWTTVTRHGRWTWHWTASIQVSDLMPVTYSGPPAMTAKGARRRALRAIEHHAADTRAARAQGGTKPGPFVDADGRLWAHPVVGVSTRTVDEFLGDDDDD